MFILALLWLLHALVLVGGSAVLLGWIKLLKARMQGRRGPGLFQPLRDLRKWFRKEAVVSNDASLLSLAAPYVSFALVFCAALMIPLFTQETPFGFTGDALVFLYMLAAARFISALAAIDSGSNFTGMGASRELAISVVVEPAVLLTLLRFMLEAGSSRLDVILSGNGAIDITTILAAFAFLLILLAETGRIPVDNPDTHLELTMIHEGMILEYSGRYLALMNLSLWIRQWIWVNLAAYLFVPSIGWLPMWAGQLISVALIGILLAVIETSNAKMRLYRIPRYIGTSMMLSIMALTVYFFQ